VRVFSVSPLVLRALAAGCEGLHDAIAEVMAESEQDPEVHVLRDSTSESEPPKWSVVVCAGDAVRELALDVGGAAAAQAAVAFLIISVIDDLRRELPELMAQQVVIEGIISVIVAASRLARRERPS
jgi:hypothetical protein